MRGGSQGRERAPPAPRNRHPCRFPRRLSESVYIRRDGAGERQRGRGGRTAGAPQAASRSRHRGPAVAGDSARAQPAGLTPPAPRTPSRPLPDGSVQMQGISASHPGAAARGSKVSSLSTCVAGWAAGIALSLETFRIGRRARHRSSLSLRRGRRRRFSGAVAGTLHLSAMAVDGDGCRRAAPRRSALHALESCPSRPSRLSQHPVVGAQTKPRLQICIFCTSVCKCGWRAVCRLVVFGVGCVGVDVGVGGLVTRFGWVGGWVGG